MDASLECPDPEGCPVPVERFAEWASNRFEQFSVEVVEPDVSWFRVYSANDTFYSPNPGHGDTRFAPFRSGLTGAQVPTLYLAESLSAALMETVFHEVPVDPVPGQVGVVRHRDLWGRLCAEVFPPRALRLLDLRDDGLGALGVGRSELVACESEHYPCTRSVARLIHDACEVDGLLWHSRQAERLAGVREEAAVVFCDRVVTHRGSWSMPQTRAAVGNLFDGSGWDTVLDVANMLNLAVEHDPTK